MTQIILASFLEYDKQKYNYIQSLEKLVVVFL